jgi:hypothetical protein
MLSKQQWEMKKYSDNTVELWTWHKSQRKEIEEHWARLSVIIHEALILKTFCFYVRREAQWQPLAHVCRLVDQTGVPIYVGSRLSRNDNVTLSYHEGSWHDSQYKLVRSLWQAKAGANSKCTGQFCGGHFCHICGILSADRPVCVLCDFTHPEGPQKSSYTMVQKEMIDATQYPSLPSCSILLKQLF